MIKEIVYQIEDQKSYSYAGDIEYHPEVQQLMIKNGWSTLPANFIDELVNHYLKQDLKQEGLDQKPPNSSDEDFKAVQDQAKTYIRRTKVMHQPLVTDRMTDDQFKSFKKKIKSGRVRRIDDESKLQSVVEDENLRRQSTIENLSAIERYKHDHWDQSNIFDLLGWCRWGRSESKTKKEWKRITPESYDPIMISLIDYRINTNPPEHIKQFNLEWVQNFLMWLIENGHVKDVGQKTRNFNPWKADVHLFKNGAREKYDTASSFYAKVKEIKRYVQELVKAGYLKIDFTDKLEAKDFHNFQDNQDYEAKYFIDPKVFLKLYNAKLLDKQLDHTRDLFVCQVLLGGIPPVDFYNQSKMKLRRAFDDKLIIKFFRQKTSGKIVNPLLKPVVEITKKYGGELPPTIKAEGRRNAKEFSNSIYTDRLRKLFQIIVPKEMWEQEVSDLENGGYKTFDPVPLHTVISPKWARSTCVVLLYSLDVKPDMIMSFTGHKKADVFYKHYFSVLQSDKLKAGNDALEKLFGKGTTKERFESGLIA